MGIKIAITVYMFFSTLVYVSMIGKPREPITPRDAVISLATYAFIVWGLWLI